MMKAIVHKTGEPLVLATVPVPDLTPNAVRIRIKATAINRADIMQRGGTYPVPPGASPYMGLEAMGTVTEVGAQVNKFRGGERVMALTNGGGYAEEVVVDAGSVLLVPETFSDKEAAGFMETYITAFLNIFVLGAVPDGGSVLIHGGGSGVGTSALSMLKEAGMTSFVTVGSEAKAKKCLEFGATHAINYKTQNFVEEVMNKTRGAGVNVILDCVGGPYFNDDLAALARDGSIVYIGMMGGAVAKDANLGLLMGKRATVIGSTLRSRTDAYKADLVQKLVDRFGEAINAGRLRPVIDTVLPLAKAEEAQELMKSSTHFGKIVLAVQ